MKVFLFSLPSTLGAIALGNLSTWIAAGIASLAPISVVIAAYIGRRKLTEIHVSVDGRFSELERRLEDAVTERQTDKEAAIQERREMREEK